MPEGVGIDNLNPITSADWLIGLQETTPGVMETGRISTDDFASQVAANPAIQAGITPAVTAAQAAQTAAEQAATNAQTAAAEAIVARSVSVPSWAALVAMTPEKVGQMAMVAAADTGTHTGRTAASPGADVTAIPNAGLYGAYGTVAGAWRRDGDLTATGLASSPQTIDGTNTTLAVTPQGDKAALDARFSGLRAEALPAGSSWLLPFVDGARRILGGWQISGRFKAKLTDDSVVPAAALPSSVLAGLMPAGITWKSVPPESGYIFVIVDAVGHILGGFDLQGHFRTRLAAGVGVSQSEIAPLVATAVSDLHLTPSPRIVAPGDSMTAGAGGGGTTYLTALAAETGATTVNLGIGGQDSTQIAARQGGVPITVTVTGNSIPASGGVAVTAKSVNILYNSGAFSGTATGTLAGIAGTMSTDTSGNWTFTRTVAGSATACPAGSVFLPDTSVTYSGDTTIIWAGRNNYGSFATVRSDILAMVRHLTPVQKRVLVLGVCNGQYAAEGSGGSEYAKIIALNSELASLFGDRFVDIRRYMIDHGLSDAGLTATADDLTDISQDRIPRQLLSDNLHWTAAGYTVAGKLLARILWAKGWL